MRSSRFSWSSKTSRLAGTEDNVSRWMLLAASLSSWSPSISSNASSSITEITLSLKFLISSKIPCQNDRIYIKPTHPEKGSTYNFLSADIPENALELMVKMALDANRSSLIPEAPAKAPSSSSTSWL